MLKYHLIHIQVVTKNRFLLSFEHRRQMAGEKKRMKEKKKYYLISYLSNLRWNNLYNLISREESERYLRWLDFDLDSMFILIFFSNWYFNEIIENYLPDIVKILNKKLSIKNNSINYKGLFNRSFSSDHIPYVLIIYPSHVCTLTGT